METPSLDSLTLEHPMPICSEHNDTVAQVMDDNHVSQSMLSQWTGLNTGTISRIYNGTIGVPLPVVQQLWQHTRDPRLIQIAFGETDAVVVGLTEQDERPDVTTATLVLATTSFNQTLLNGDKVHTDPCVRAAAENAVRYLLGFIRKSSNGEPIPFQLRPARRLSHAITA